MSTQTVSTEMTQSTAEKRSFSYEDLIACGEGQLFGQGNAKLPLPPMLMFDRITELSQEGGKFGKGYVLAELDINPDLWFFACHFKGDPVMPGCLGLDAMWQLVGFFLGQTGAQGSGRALGLGELKLTGQVTPETKTVKYVINLKRVINRRLVLGIADAEMYADDQLIYQASDLKVGLFDNPKALSGDAA